VPRFKQYATFCHDIGVLRSDMRNVQDVYSLKTPSIAIGSCLAHNCRRGGIFSLTTGIPFNANARENDMRDVPKIRNFHHPYHEVY